MPLVNCHTHLELGWMASLCPQPPGEPFTGWIGKLIRLRREKSLAGEEERLSRQAVEAGIQALLDAGTTHVGDISQSGLSIEPLLDSGLAGAVYIEIIGTERQGALASFARARSLVEKYRPQERHGLRLGLTPHAPYSTHPEAIRAAAAYCRQEGVPLCIHTAESPHEAQALLHGTGPFLDLTRRINTAPPPLPGATSVRYLHTLGVLEARPLLVHMVHVDDEELDLVAASGASVAHCPRSNQLLQCGRMPLEKMLARGIPVALGTDGLSSSPSLDVRQEAEAAIRLHEAVLPAAAITPLLGQTALFGG